MLVCKHSTLVMRIDANGEISPFAFRVFRGKINKVVKVLTPVTGKGCCDRNVVAAEILTYLIILQQFSESLEKRDATVARERIISNKQSITPPENSCHLVAE